VYTTNEIVANSTTPITTPIIIAPIVVSLELLCVGVTEGIVGVDGDSVLGVTVPFEGAVIVGVTDGAEVFVGVLGTAGLVGEPVGLEVPFCATHAKVCCERQAVSATVAVSM